MLDRVESRGMPGYGGADIIEQAVARHIGLRRTTFLSGAAIVADTRLDPGFRKPVLDGGCGKQRRRAKQIMPAPMAVTTVGNRSVFSNTRFLAQAGKGIKFTQNGDDGAFVSASPMTAVGMPQTFCVILKPSASSVETCSFTD